MIVVTQTMMCSNPTQLVLCLNLKLKLTKAHVETGARQNTQPKQTFSLDFSVVLQKRTELTFTLEIGSSTLLVQSL